MLAAHPVQARDDKAMHEVPLGGAKRLLIALLGGVISLVALPLLLRDGQLIWVHGLSLFHLIWLSCGLLVGRGSVLGSED